MVKSNKIVSETGKNPLGVAINNVTNERNKARDELIRLIKQAPSSNFFVRTFQRARNFLHSWFPSWNVFKSPLEAASEELVQREKNLSVWDNLIVDRRKDTNRKSAKQLRWWDRSLIKKSPASLPVDSTTDKVAGAFEEVLTANTSLDATLKTALTDYINRVKKELSEMLYFSDSGCIDSWSKVREALVNKQMTPELEDILFKLKVLYPCTIQYDKRYVPDIKKKTVNDSTVSMTETALEHTIPLTKQNNLTPQETRSEFTLFDYCMGRSQRLAEKAEQLPIQEQYDEIATRINNLPSTCGKIAKIKNLQLVLRRLLAASVQNEKRDVKRLNETITGWINNLQVSLFHKNISTEATDITSAQEIITTLRNDINRLGKKDLACILATASDPSDTLRL